MDETQKKKVGDLLCDIGKYMVTVVPFGYFFSNKPDAGYIIVAIAIFGLLFMLFGLYFLKQPHNTVARSAKKKKIRILKNATFVVEEEKD